MNTETLSNATLDPVLGDERDTSIDRVSLYGTPAPLPGALAHDEERFVVWHYDPARYDGTTALELHTYQVREYKRGKRTRTERRTVGSYPLRWLAGYPEDHALGECPTCSETFAAGGASL